MAKKVGRKDRQGKPEAYYFGRAKSMGMYILASGRSSERRWDVINLDGGRTIMIYWPTSRRWKMDERSGRVEDPREALDIAKASIQASQS